jgi:cell fate (sporulation/competence/biofilm development) regulator YlbF (YheA/YmcA/DUF963 family)
MSSTKTDNKKGEKKSEKEGEENVLENFKICIQDFTTDLSITFPEFHHQWARWQNPELPVSEWEKLLEYCKKTYPERFFDLLYKNEEIFALPGAEGDVKIEDVDSDEDEDDKWDEKREVDVYFLPSVDFRKLYHCQGVTESTKESIWKYLQMILFLIMKTVKSSEAFGETEDLFAGVNEKELQEQMKTTLENLAEFFQKSEEETGEEAGSGEKTGASDGNQRPEGKGPTTGLDGMPDIDDINDHLKNLMGGKIGQFAEEIMGEYSKDLEDVIGDVKNAKSVKDVVGHMFKNSGKMKNLLKKIQDKFKEKMDSGEISKEDVMKETKEIFSKLKGMKKGKEMNQYMKSMMATMGGLGGMGAGLGKNTKMDLGAMERMIKKEETAERLRAKAEANRKAKEMEGGGAVKYGIQQTAPNQFTFKVDDAPAPPKSKLEKKQEAEKAQKELDDLVNFIESKPSVGKKKKGGK